MRTIRLHSLKPASVHSVTVCRGWEAVYRNKDAGGTPALPGGHSYYLLPHCETGLLQRHAQRLNGKLTSMHRINRIYGIWSWEFGVL